MKVREILECWKKDCLFHVYERNEKSVETLFMGLGSYKKLVLEDSEKYLDLEVEDYYITPDAIMIKVMIKGKKEEVAIMCVKEKDEVKVFKLTDK